MLDFKFTSCGNGEFILKVMLGERTVLTFIATKEEFMRLLQAIEQGAKP